MKTTGSREVDPWTGISKQTHGVRHFKINEGFNLDDMRAELKEYTDVLLGRIEPPIDVGVMTMMELAEAYHARAREMEMNLLELENDGVVLKGTRAYRFRTGQLRSFISLADKTIDLGSRRVTYARDLAQGKG